MIIPIDTEKVFDRNQHHFMIRPLYKLELDRNFLNLIKGIYENLTVNITLNGEFMFSS